MYDSRTGCTNSVNMHCFRLVTDLFCSLSTTTHQHPKLPAACGQGHAGLLSLSSLLSRGAFDFASLTPHAQALAAQTSLPPHRSIVWRVKARCQTSLPAAAVTRPIGGEPPFGQCLLNSTCPVYACVKPAAVYRTIAAKLAFHTCPGSQTAASVG